MRRVLRPTPLCALVALSVVFGRVGPASAHVGSPNVFYEGDAGPYHVFVTVRVPQVIPGVAEIDVRAPSPEIREVRTSVARLTGPGSNYAPVPDFAKRSPIDPQLFTSSLWLMEYGSLRVLLNVDGTRGPGSVSVPVPSAGQRMLPMPRLLGATLLVLAIALGLGAISIVGAAAREARLVAGAPIAEDSRTRGRRAMLIMTVAVAGIFYFAFSWWDSDAQSYARVNALFKPPLLSATLDRGNQLELRAADANGRWLKFKVMEHLIPDHGHLMHLFLVRTPNLDRLWHLHPTDRGSGIFVQNLPSVQGGSYAVFADVVDESGFPWTLVGRIELPTVSGAALGGDDSDAVAKAVATPDSSLDVLDDGTRVIWRRDPVIPRTNEPLSLRFEVEDSQGKPAADLAPYMGMAAHVEVMKSDLSVFAHIHPSGSVPMASLILAAADPLAESSIGSSGNDSKGSHSCGVPGRSVEVQPSDGQKSAPTEAIAPEISIPYGFPSAGLYRLFFQFKRGNRIETATFDTRVS